MKIFFVLITISIVSTGFAQSKLSYTAGAEASLLKGSNADSHAFLFTNGISYKHTMFGIGGGIDDYGFRSIPLFIDVRKSLGHGSFQPFANASAGININDATNAEKWFYNGYSDARFKNGFYTRLSAGISTKMYRCLRVFISAGYSYKTTKITYGGYSPSPGLPVSYNTDIYRMNRWQFSAGFWF